MHKFLLLINTIKYLKFQQIYFRVVRKFIKPKVDDKFIGLIYKRTGPRKILSLYKEKVDRHLNAYSLNHCELLDLPVDWNNEVFSKLWSW